MVNFHLALSISRKTSWILASILVVKFILGSWGISWGLPDRWNTDEQIADSLTMIANKTLYSPHDTTHPTFHKFVLAFLFLIYLALLQLFGHALSPYISAGSISWLNLAQNFPDFAATMYLIGRWLSVFSGLASIYLIYLIAKYIFEDKNIALLSSAILTLNMGLNTTNHYAKADSLVVLMVLLVCYFCLKSLKGKDFLKNFLAASFLAGLALATKWDGGIAILFLMFSYFSHLNSSSLLKEHQSIIPRIKLLFNFKIASLSVFFYLFGAFIGWPDGFLSPHRYIGTGSVTARLPASAQNLLPLYLGQIKTYSILFIKIFGLPLALFAFVFFFKLLFQKKRYPKHLKMIMIMLICYIFVALIVYTRYKGGGPKFIILSVPFLCMFAAVGLYEFWQWSRLNLFIRLFLIITVFLYSSFYVWKSDLVFSRKDTRYASTRWVLDNLEETQTLEHLQEADLLYSPSKVFNQVEIIYYGRSSRTHNKNKSFFKLNGTSLAYLGKINLEGSPSDYFITASGHDFLYWPDEITSEPANRFLLNLISGKKKEYELVKKFIYQEDLWFNPRPTYTCPEIYIFRRKNR